MKNTSFKEIAELLGIESDVMTNVTGYQVDSRRVGAGELFFALPGERVDGHSFLNQVAERGGVGAVVSRGYAGPDFGLILLRVDDVLEALQSLAKWAVSKTKAQIVAITGSMGKTTTKDFAATLLEGKFRVGKTYSSYNTKLTLPITILNMSGDEDVWVLEMGMGEVGDIAKLIEIAPPDVAVVTQVTMAHYGSVFPDGVAGVMKAKGEIFGSAKTKKAIYFHGGDFPDVRCEKVTYSLKSRDADYFLADGVVDEKGVRAYRFDVPFPQPHVQHNFLGAVAIARALKMGWDEIENQVEKLRLPKMRFEQFEKDGILWINDAYNANPESVKAALSCMEVRSGKRIAVLGRMVDLGPFSEAAHEEVGRFALGHCDYLLTLGCEAVPLSQAFSAGKKPAEHFEDLNRLKARLKELVAVGDVILVKGSRDLAMEWVFDVIDSV